MTTEQKQQKFAVGQSVNVSGRELLATALASSGGGPFGQLILFATIDEENGTDDYVVAARVAIDDETAVVQNVYTVPSNVDADDWEDTSARVYAYALTTLCKLASSW
jgi:hypothetical protein